MFTFQTQSNNYPYICLRESEKILRCENTVEIVRNTLRCNEWNPLHCPKTVSWCIIWEFCFWLSQRNINEKEGVRDMTKYPHKKRRQNQEDRNKKGNKEVNIL